MKMIRKCKFHVSIHNKMVQFGKDKKTTNLIFLNGIINFQPILF